MPGDETFCKTDVTRFESRRAGLPVVQMQGRMRRCIAAETLHRAIGQLQR